jgi:hypothetical protein
MHAVQWSPVKVVSSTSDQEVSSVKGVQELGTQLDVVGFRELDSLYDAKIRSQRIVGPLTTRFVTTALVRCTPERNSRNCGAICTDRSVRRSCSIGWSACCS